MKTTIYCLLIALCLRFAYGQVENKLEPHFAILGGWLTLEVKGAQAKPETTRIFSTRQPMMCYHMSSREWEIVFK